MDKIKINTQILGDIPNVKTLDEVNNSLSIINLSEELSTDKTSEINSNISPITLNEELSNDKTEQLDDNANQNNIQEQDGNIIPRTYVTIKKEPIKSPTVIEEKMDVTAGKKSIKDLFVNYDSDFHKNEKTIMQRIRLFKMTPRTSTGFVVISIVVTISIVALMMQLDPENQSLDNYKASLLSLIGPKTNTKIVNTGIVNTPPQVLNENIGETEIPTQTGSTGTGIVEEQTQTGITSTGAIENTTQTGVTNTGVIEEENLIKEKWLTVKPDIIVKEDGSTEYMYKGQSFSKESLQEELKKDVKAEIDKKTNDYLSKHYINN
ncbi:MAG: hypothetical protein WC850_04300 [Candidatus Gracilibacteria bacterium]